MICCCCCCFCVVINIENKWHTHAHTQESYRKDYTDKIIIFSFFLFISQKTILRGNFVIWMCVVGGKKRGKKYSLQEKEKRIRQCFIRRKNQKSTNLTQGGGGKATGRTISYL